MEHPTVSALFSGQEKAYCHHGILSKHVFPTFHAVSLSCRSWLCPICGPMRRKALIAQGIAGHPNYFITYTSKRTEGGDPEEAAREQCKAIRIMRKRAMREAKRNPQKHPLPFGAPPPGGWTVEPGCSLAPMVTLINQRWSYLCVMEKTENGWPHVHELSRLEWISHTWLSAQMLDLTGSPIVWIEQIEDPEKGAVYVAKYCGKADEKFQSCKRYWQTRDYQLEPKHERPIIDQTPGNWERQPMSLDEWCSMWTTVGWTIERIDARSAIARAPP